MISDNISEINTVYDTIINRFLPLLSSLKLNATLRNALNHSLFILSFSRCAPDGWL